MQHWAESLLSVVVGRCAPALRPSLGARASFLTMRLLMSAILQWILELLLLSMAACSLESSVVILSLQDWYSASILATES